MKFYRCLNCGKVIHVLKEGQENICCYKEMLEIKKVKV